MRTPCGLCRRVFHTGKVKKKDGRKIPPDRKAAVTNTKHLFALLFLSLSVFLAYWSSLHGTWAMDDVVANKPVGLHDIQDFTGFRKVAYLTFLLNQSVAPFTPANFRLFNILLHLLNAALVYVIAYKTMALCIASVRGNTPLNPPLMRGELKGGTVIKGKPPVRLPLMREAVTGGGNPVFYAALLSSVLFALHPININAVAYIVQRMAALAAFFSLLSLLGYIYATLSGSKVKAILLYFLSGVFLIAGIFSKENAVVIIPLIVLYDYVFLSKFDFAFFKKRVFVIAAIGIVSVIAASYFLKLHSTAIDIISFFLHPNNALPERGWMAVDVYWTPLQHILTEFRVVSRYLMIILIPIPKLLVFDWWGFPLSEGLTKPITTVPSMLFLISLIVFSVLKIRRFPLLCFGILWYFIAISLESFFAIGSDLYFEHRNYLPVAGLFIGAAGQMVLVLKDKINGRIVWTAAGIVAILLGSLTFARNYVWKDSLTLWGDTMKKTPSNIRAMISMGNAYVMEPDFDAAKRHYQNAVRMSAEGRRLTFLNASAYRLGLAYLFERNLPAAGDLIATMEQTIDSYQLTILKGFYKASSGDVDGAIQLYNKVLPATKRSDTVVVHTLLGDAFREKGSWDKAVEHYQKALSRDIGFSAAYYGLGVSYMGKRDLVRADYYFTKALSIDPNNILALSDMADLMLLKRQRPEDALIYARRAVSKDPPLYQPYLTMGNVLLVLGRDKDAEDYYRKAVERGMSGYMVPFSKARAYYMKGDVSQAGHYISELRKYRDLPEKFKGLLEQQN